MKTELLEEHNIKKSRNTRLYECKWHIGDVFAYKLESSLAKDRNLFGRYFLIQKIDEDVWHPGHIVPIVYVKITNDDSLPINEYEYNQLDFIQTGFTTFEERFFPIDYSRYEEDIAEKSKIKYEVDEYGFLPQFRVTLLNTSKKVIPTSLIYLGNFSNITAPQKEFVPHTKVNILPVFWEKFNETFETKMIRLYCGHNLRELKIYSKD